jgi:hypothetical protein
MHRSLHFVVATQVLLCASCAAPTPRATAPPRPPKIEGAVSSVSPRDIRQVIGLVQQGMRHEFGRTFAIERIEVKSRNEVWVIYHRDTFECSVPVRRVHGVWTPPPEGVWVI